MPYKPINKARHKGGRDIVHPDNYDNWANLHKIKERIKMLKADLKRDCKPYYKFDQLIQDIEQSQKLIIHKDKLQEYK
tara:strand:- start:272 stop:505 length:234 start_codon:yes stop_codon:yes gene_type:complete